MAWDKAVATRHAPLANNDDIMMRRLCRWLTPLAVLVLCAAGARAEGESGSERVPVLGYFLAFLFTVAALVIVCMPSRKS